MEPTCGRCKGDGGHASRTGFHWIKCNVCSGTGINPNYREKPCERCGTKIGYHCDSPHPPTYCLYCRDIVAKEREERRAERERQNAMWQEKRCPGLRGGSYCGNTIKYRTDWTNIPNICPDCREKAKARRAENEAKKAEREAKIAEDKAKWKEKPCAGGCGETIRYHTDWAHPPNYCKSCKEKQHQRPEPNYSENQKFDNACRDAGLSDKERKRFSRYYHESNSNIKHLTYQQILQDALDWKSQNKGKFLRSDRY